MFKIPCSLFDIPCSLFDIPFPCPIFRILGTLVFPEQFLLVSKNHFMRIIKYLSAVIFTTGSLIISCSNPAEKKSEETTATKEAQWHEDNVTYFDDSTAMNGLVVYELKDEVKKPAVLVVHEWWGLNDYPKMRARELAKLGYVAMAVDVYGNGKTADNPDSAGKYAMAFYKDPQLAKSRINAAIARIKSYPQVDTTRIAAIGYCFGGGILLNTARLGNELKGVVSFHGSLLGTPANKDLLKTKILVCHGGADPFVPETEVNRFKKQMDSIGADYTFKVYPGAKHAFTNPNATEAGKKFNIPIAYDAAADSASWNDMKSFFATVFR
jgi:dienelactone hydrolase